MCMHAKVSRVRCNPEVEHTVSTHTGPSGSLKGAELLLCALRTSDPLFLLPAFQRASGSAVHAVGSIGDQPCWFHCHLLDCGFILVLPASSPTLFLVQDQDQIQNSLLCSDIGGILVTLAVPDKNLRGSLSWGLCDVYSWVSWTCSALHSDDGLFLRCPRVLGFLLQC